MEVNLGDGAAKSFEKESEVAEYVYLLSEWVCRSVYT